ncbi:MAG TPA: hypothetical protein VGI95_13020 [Caulobacteraceae bacterium]|jgi:hypothetical protein
MLARLTLLLIALPALALAADAGSGSSGKLRLVTPAPKAAQIQTVANPAPTQASSSPVAQADPSECRMGCAQAYYFCRGADHAEDCAPTWGQCVATCNSPALSPGYSTAP